MLLSTTAEVWLFTLLTEIVEAAAPTEPDTPATTVVTLVLLSAATFTEPESLRLLSFFAATVLLTSSASVVKSSLTTPTPAPTAPETMAADSAAEALTKVVLWSCLAEISSPLLVLVMFFMVAVTEPSSLVAAAVAAAAPAP